MGGACYPGSVKLEIWKKPDFRGKSGFIGYQSFRFCTTTSKEVMTAC